MEAIVFLLHVWCGGEGSGRSGGLGFRFESLECAVGFSDLGFWSSGFRDS